MTVTCPKCSSKLKLSDEKARPEGTRIKCPKCGAVLVYKGKARKESPEREGVKESTSAVSPPPSEISATRSEAGGKEPAGIRKPGQVPRPTKPKIETIDRVKVSLPSEGEEKRGGPRKAVLAASAAGVVIVLLIVVFFFLSPGKTLQKITPTAPLPAVQETTRPAPQAAVEPYPPENPPGASSEPPLPEAVPADEDFSATPEEKAVAMVKKSDVLLKMTTVESIVDKWAKDNAAKYKIVGWQAKKIEEQQYLVSYTAMEGDKPKGFYFIADIQNGTVEDLAHKPELQKKYNVQYGQ
jgi:predicted Zn finger-like uncharacterized protein